MSVHNDGHEQVISLCEGYPVIIPVNRERKKDTNIDKNDFTMVNMN